MNWDNFDANPGENEDEYEARKMQESQSSTGIMFGLFGLLIFILKIATIFGMFFYGGFLMSQKFWGGDVGKFKFWGMSLLFTYLIFCIIYFIKGTIIGLLTKNNRLWILPWILCVFICCIVPAFIVKSLVVSMFNLTEQRGILCIALSWGAFVLCLLYIYKIYQFKTATAPKILRWSFTWGFKVSS